VVAQHHLSSTVYRKALKEEFRRCYPRVDAVVSLTKTDAAEYAKVVEHKTRVLAIPNGVPDVHGCAATAKPDNDSKLVVVGARLTRQKGIDRLLDVWALVAARHPDWRLEIYGSGDATVLQQKAVELGIADSALFMGRTSRLPEVMSGASIFVLTSRFEGFPMVLLEAMTIGLPVVSYDCPTGPSELIEDGRNGYLVPNGDAETFADRLSDLMQDPGKRRTFGAAATEIAGRYDTHVLAERWEQLFTELAADPRRAERRAPRPIGRRSEADPCARLAPRQTLTRLYQGLTAIRPVDARKRSSRSRVASKNSSTA
jgi:glycosyltransferase involved in cell wall biosynthesis